MEAGVDATRYCGLLEIKRTMLVVETKEERGLAYLKGHPSRIKTAEFAQKAALRSQFCCQFNRAIPAVISTRIADRQI
jgi:hypothetical protein